MTGKGSCEVERLIEGPNLPPISWLDFSFHAAAICARRAAGEIRLGRVTRDFMELDRFTPKE